MIAAAVVCALACIALLISEWKEWRAGVWIAKPLAAAGFVSIGLAAGALGHAYGRWILAGLLLSWLGDVLLLPRERERIFLAGVASFAAAHVAYAAAFATLGLSVSGLVGASALTLGGAFAALGWLRPHLDGIFARAVPAYVAIIGTMVVLAGSAAVTTGIAAIAVGAVGFAVSDVSVARQRFVTRSLANAMWGLPLYFASQALLAWTISAVAR